jgi:ribonuclease HI
MAEFKVNIYTDTSFHGPRTREGAAGFMAEFVTKSGTTVTRPEEIEDRFFTEWETTETKLTVEALIAAFALLKLPCEATVYTTCPQVRAALSQNWPDKWAANDWKTSAGEEVKHADLWGTLREEMEPHRVQVAEEETTVYTSWFQAELSKRAHNMRTVRTTGELGDPEPHPITFF